MQCPRCQQDAPSDAAFCPKCGAKLAVTCAQCGTANAPTDNFCKKCGQRLSRPEAAQAVPGPRFGSPESYTPKHLAEKILTSRGALEGERKQVTVLFADLKGSMELLADRDPEEARKLLDPVLERMMEAVHRYEGTVNQVMGDGIMALFGAPVAHEDHAVRACYAALDMQAAIRGYAEEARRAHGINPQIRVGLNSGDVVVRAIGSDLHMDYTAVGQTTHLASRMEQFASPGTIVLTADTLRLAEGYVEVKPLGPVPVKGLEAPVEVYEVIGAGPRRSRLHAAAARGLTRFVGRESELEQLRQALGRASSGHGQAVAIVGEPGVGKSRLVWEVTHSHRTHGWLTVPASSVSYGKATPYVPVVDLLKAYFRIEDRDSDRQIREKVTGKLLTLDRALEPTLPAFLALLDTPVDESSWQTLDPPQRRQRTLEAVKRLLLREAQVQPLLVIFEDLHWIDAETQALLDGLVESLPTARLLLLVNYRPEYEHRWGSKTYYIQLRLDPLPPESAGELLRAVLGDDPTLEPLKRLLIERTEGNPFFLEESIRTLVEAKVFAGERGAYRLVKAVSDVQVPPTVQAVLAARIDRLPPEQKRLVQTASVIGKDVPFGLLQAVADRPEDDLRRDLAHLQAAEFLYETSLFPELEYTFKHALTHEVAYGSLLQERRRALHARIVDAIESRHADRLAEQVERLAYHAFRGETWEKAIEYLRQAGSKAADRSAHREAVGCLEQALAALTPLGRDAENVRRGIDLRLQLRNSLFPLTEFDRLREVLGDAERLAAELGDQGRLGLVCAYRAHHLRSIGEHRQALEAGRRALTIAESLEDVTVEVLANFAMGQTYHAVGDYRWAIEHLTRAIDAIPDDRVRDRFSMAIEPATVCRTWLAWCLAECGDFAKAAARAEESSRISESVDRLHTRFQACWAQGLVALYKGDLPEAIAALQRARSLADVGNLSTQLAASSSDLGYAHALAGHTTEALALLKPAGERAARRYATYPSRWVAGLSEAYLLAGHTDEAAGLANEAPALARERKERGMEAWGLRLLGEVASRGDPLEVESAEVYYSQALALATELGMRPLMAHCHLGLGKLYRRTGNGVKAQEYLTTAATMYREMGMNFWLPQAEAARAAPG